MVILFLPGRCHRSGRCWNWAARKFTGVCWMSQNGAEEEVNNTFATTGIRQQGSWMSTAIEINSTAERRVKKKSQKNKIKKKKKAGQQHTHTQRKRNKKGKKRSIDNYTEGEARRLAATFAFEQETTDTWKSGPPLTIYSRQSETTEMCPVNSFEQAKLCNPPAHLRCVYVCVLTLSVWNWN